MTAQHRSQPSPPAPVSAVAWATDLIRLEIALWDRIDARLQESHELPLAFFESLLFISRARRGSMRVGDLAQALRVTVGGTRKLIDRIERAGLIGPGPDPDNSRAPVVALTQPGSGKLPAGVQTSAPHAPSL